MLDYLAVFFTVCVFFYCCGLYGYSTYGYPNPRVKEWIQSALGEELQPTKLDIGASITFTLGLLFLLGAVTGYYSILLLLALGCFVISGSLMLVGIIKDINKDKVNHE